MFEIDEQAVAMLRFIGEDPMTYTRQWRRYVRAQERHHRLNDPYLGGLHPGYDITSFWARAWSKAFVKLRDGS